jgi:hypothetical protein
MSTNRVPLTTRPASTSMQGITRLKCTPSLWHDHAMPNLRVLLLAAALAAVAAPSASGATDPRFRSCAQVNFTPNSDDVAAAIRVKDVRCGYARRFVRDSDGSPGDTFRGFACTSRVRDDGLRHTVYRCERGAKVIRWKRF